MRITIGKPARGEKFFQRPEIRAKLKEAILDGSNILISAPRRVGKTSILLDLYDNPIDDYIIVYVDTEALDNEEDFFRRLLEELFDLDLLEKYNHINRKTLEKLSDFANRIKKVNIPVVGGLELADQKEETSYDKLVQFLSTTKLDENRILILVDEFPVTIENIHRTQGIDATKKFLQLNRTIRLNPKFNEKIQFIYTGSIGLVNVLRRFGVTEDINDLYEFFIDQLTQEDGVKFLDTILKEYGIRLSEKVLAYTIATIEWRIPFYIQSFAREIRNLHEVEKEKVLDESFIDQGLENVIDNVNIYLDHYRSRLKRTFTEDQLKFVFKVLNEISNKDNIDPSHLPEIAAEFNVLKDYEYIISTLEYDGYINNQNEDSLYRFNSPIMKLWWTKYGNK